LLLDHHALALALSGPGVGMGPLPAYRLTLAVADAAVAADVHEPFHAHRHLPAQVALHLVLPLDDVANPAGLVVRPTLDPLVGVDPRVGEDLPGRRNPDPVDVLDRDRPSFVPWQVDSRDTCHVGSYPWRCLWRGFLQMIRTRPCRRTILQFSHRTLIDGLTFIRSSTELLESICDPAPSEV